MRLKTRFLFVILTSIILTSIGCLSPRGREWTPKEWGDALELVQIGSSSNHLAQAIPRFEYKNTRYIKLNPASIGSFASLDPYSKENSSLKFYRQFPAGVLLTLAPGDLYRGVPAYDGFESTGNIVVFFDASGKFKGYYGHSSNRISADSKERLAQEKQCYRDLHIAEKLKPYIEEFEKFGHRIPSSRSL